MDRGRRGNVCLPESRHTETEHRQCVIIGGGIAGLAAAAELEHAGVDFVLVEAGERGVVVGRVNPSGVLTVCLG